MAEIDYGGGMAEGSPLWQIMQASQIQPGSDPSYELCKLIYTNHPLGKRIVDSPIARAMYKPREIIVTEAPECVIERFKEVWDEVQADYYIADCERLSRIYGISSLVLMPIDEKMADEPWTPEELYAGNFSFNSMDPLNTAGSLVGILDPNNPDFLKYSRVSIAGKSYASSRSHIQLHENPVYLSYTVSAWGYVGRSVFNRALYPLQSFIRSMIADDLMMIKSGVLVAKVGQPGSFISKVMENANQVRLNILKLAQTGNTITIKPDEAIESLDLHNLTYQDQRKNILENIALSLDMPASFLTNDSLAQGFGEGEEDAKLVSSYIDSIRLEMKPIFDWMDNIVQYVAWSPEYYATLQSRFPDYQGISYESWFHQCRRSFKALWPEALEPNKKERVQHQKNQYQSVIEVYNTLAPTLEGENKARLVEWMVANLNEADEIFPNMLEIDTDEIALRSALGLDRPIEEEDENVTIE